MKNLTYKELKKITKRLNWEIGAFDSEVPDCELNSDYWITAPNYAFRFTVEDSKTDNIFETDNIFGLSKIVEQLDTREIHNGFSDYAEWQQHKKLGMDLDFTDMEAYLTQYVREFIAFNVEK